MKLSGDSGTKVFPQGVRRFEERLRQRYPVRQRPFAYKVFYTHGKNLCGLGEHGLEELIGKHEGHLVIPPAIESFARQLRFGPDLHVQASDLSPWVEIDPAVQYGRPVVRGTRIPVRTIAANPEVGTVDQVADWYRLRVQQVEGVRGYLAAH